ncbi:MAG: hypothetical protein M3238_05615 [Actinomycetota bacterium]|nr:hypothetical protein [Actinomycetota bacterium]
MIEMQMVKRMATRAALLAPLVMVVLWVWEGPLYAFSAAVGIAMTLANLWASARIIGGIADNNPKLLLIGAMVAFTLGLALLGGVAYVLTSFEIVHFPVVGFTLIGTHMVLVLAEARTAYPIKKLEASEEVADARS